MATTISTQDLIDVKRDIDDIGKAVNEKVIVNPRYGDDFKSLPMVADEAQASIDEWQDAINTIVVNDGVPALAVSTANGESQQEINDYTGAKWRNKAGGYDLNARVMLDNGGVVRSTVAGNTVDPNVDMTGWLNFENNQLRKVYHVLDLGLKMDGSDETAKLNEIIAGLDNCRLVIGGGNLTLSKTSLYASDYPKNDQPCVPILDKTNFQIEISPDCTIHVPVHGQGAFEMMRCTGSWVIVNGAIKGAGNFPLLDGTTGRAEKGTATEGYQTQPGFYKNNSLDTSAYATGGYGKNFPQWGGGTASTWGVWNGGFIGNEGYGVLIHNDCFMCGATGIGEIFGFNGSSVQIGFNGSYLAPSLNYPPSRACIVRGLNVHDCYTNGIANISSIGSLIDLNTVHDIGHPDAQKTDLIQDPGYGIVTGYSVGHPCEDALYKNNTVFDCVRKGIDMHSGLNFTIESNKVSDCWTVGIFAAQADAPDQITVNNKIRNNTIMRCGSLPNSRIYSNNGGIQVSANATNDATNCEVFGNTVTDCLGGFGAINIQAGAGAIVKGNTVSSDVANLPDDANFHAGISIGEGYADKFVSRTVVEDNNIITNAKMAKGIVTKNGDGVVKKNTIRMPAGVVGIDHIGGSGAKFDYIDNFVVADAGRAYAIEQTSGISRNNLANLYGTATLGNTSTNKASGAVLASAIITFNNTTSPTISITKGSDIIDSVVNDTYGFKLVLKNLASFHKVFASVERTTAEGLVAAGGNANYIYVRQATHQEVIVGIQLTPASTAIPAASVVRNSLRIDLLVTD